MRILMVEDYAPIRSAVAAAIAEQGMAIDAAVDGDEGWWYINNNRYDAIILDVMLPGRSGMELLMKFRATGDRTPVILVTARDTVEERIAGLDAGADDYLVKPFATSELLARIRSLVRRGHGQASGILTHGQVVLDSAARTVQRDGLPVELTPREFALLEYLLHHPGQVVSRDELIEHVYSFADDVTPNAVEVFVSSLRRKLERGDRSRLVHTKRGFGYVFAEDAP
jgi:DNA-binding response OmpR family regulator